MIVRILSSAASFAGVSYNTCKIESGRGELMLTANFGALQGLQHLRPEDYRNYLKMISARNKAVKKPQFHVTLSAKGSSYDKQALTGIAVKWLTEMGYREQPYLIVFHNDTGNNHIHIVSTRIDRDGKKINSAFENIRAVKCLNSILGLDEQYDAKQDIDRALTFAFSTGPQFKMILEDMGYTIKENGQHFTLFKYGSEQFQIERKLIDEHMECHQPGQKRKTQIRALLNKYAKVYDPALKERRSAPGDKNGQPSKAYFSDLARFLNDKLGLNLVFHAKDGKPPYGYSIIDRPGKNVYKGSEVMPLKELLELTGEKNNEAKKDRSKTLTQKAQWKFTKGDRYYYLTLLKAAIHNYPDMKQGLHHLQLEICHRNGELILADPGRETFVAIRQLFKDPDQADLMLLLNEFREPEAELHSCSSPVPGIHISTDADDEALYGRRRRRKKHSRTNSR